MKKITINEKIKDFLYGVAACAVAIVAFVFGNDLFRNRKSASDAGKRIKDAEGSADELEASIDRSAGIFEEIRKQQIEK